MQTLRQQLADDKQRGDMAKGELEQKLLDLRSERQQRAEEFEATELEIDTLRQSTTETMAAVEAQLAEDAALRAQLEAATGRGGPVATG